MFRRISNSWELIKASAAVLQADKELLIFPIVSAIGSVIVMITFAVPMFLTGLFEAMAPSESGAVNIVGYIVAFAFYLVQYFVIIFANSALVGAAMIRLEGGDPTVGDGFRIALKHIGSIFGYALVSATVGLILRWLSERGILGRIASSLVGMAWNLATYLVVPVLVVEGVGPVDAIKRSTEMLKRTWGEQIAGNFGVGLIFGVLIFGVIIVGVIATFAIVSATSSVALIALVVLFFVAIVILLSLISSALSGIYSAAVYRYAAKGEIGSFFRRELVEEAFRTK